MSIMSTEKLAGKSLEIKVVKRDGTIVNFESSRIKNALTNAFVDVEGTCPSKTNRIHDIVSNLTNEISAVVQRRVNQSGSNSNVEEIQDQVELALMRNGYQQVARSYVIYREKRREARNNKEANEENTILITNKAGKDDYLSKSILENLVNDACHGIEHVDASKILTSTYKDLFPGIKEIDVKNTLIYSTRTLIELEPNYSYVAARLLLLNLQEESGNVLLGRSCDNLLDLGNNYSDYFAAAINYGIDNQLLDKQLLGFDLKKLGDALKPENDLEFNYLGLQTLYDRYFLHKDEIRFELPQVFFMRVAMGLALQEDVKEDRAIEFYNTLSGMNFMSSTPTLFNSGTLRSQLSSCYLTTVPDDLYEIYGSMRDNALLSKYAGGLGNDWTPVRAMNSYIKGTNGKSQGVVPFLKVANDTAVAVNQGGKRKGAVCAYLETWHLDIEEFLELRKNTGDERRRTHDMNTANWIPDLFMERVIEDANWTLFSPNDVSDLHELYGKEFNDKYKHYEKQTETGEITQFKSVRAVSLWRKMIAMIYETGHPWFTFKDPCNIRSPQQHVGVVHSSNLCTEITLNTSVDEIAVCNLGSINLAKHIVDGKLDLEKLSASIKTAIRMLDNVIDINYYAVSKARQSNIKHRPIGLGIMGFQDALYKLDIDYKSDQAVDFADYSMEHISYFAIEASSNLAQERGSYQSYEGSLWSKGILPIDSISLLKKSRNKDMLMDSNSKLDWQKLRDQIKTFGIRNSNVMAIAPTATISNICGVSQSIEPTYSNLFVKSNLSGEFTIVNPYLVADLKKLGLWDKAIVHELKYYDGSLKPIDKIPQAIKDKYATAFEIDPSWLIRSASKRQKWIDQSQSLNLYINQPSGKKLDQLYKMAWSYGLKTTYYLRSLAATGTEKSTIADGKLNAVSDSKICSINNQDECESCQ